MATTYTTLLKLAKPTQGELDGSWGTVVNDNITSMIEEAIAGRSVINTWSGNSATLSTANGTTAESRSAMLSLTDTGTNLSGAATVICPALSKIYILTNGTGQTATLKTASGTGIAVPNGKTMLLYCDGTNVVEGVDHIAGALTTGGDITASGTVGATGDTAAGDDAALGYTSAEGLILTGQGSTSDITVKNDADAAVLTVATGTTNVDIVGDVTASTVNADGDTAAGDDAAMGYTSAEGLILTGQGSTNDVTIKNDADADVITIATGGTNVDIVGDVTAATVNADGDTSAGDGAAMGYTSAEGLILTGQGSTNDVTIKNDADADVITIATGGTNVDIVGDVTASTVQADGDTAAGDNAAMGYTSTEGLILTGQGSTNDVTIKNDADADVLEIPTGSTNVTVVGNITAGGTLGASGDITATGGTLIATGDTAAGDDAAIGYTSAEGIIITGQGSTNDVTIKNDADADVITIATGGTNVDIVGDVTASTVNADGDTAAGDDAAMGWTSAEGLILTGQGSTNDVTIKNDADADVITIATGATNVDIVGDVTASTVNADGDTAAGDNAAMGYTAAEGLILTGQGSTNDVTIKNDADADVLEIPTGTTNVSVVGSVTASSFAGSGSGLTAGTTPITTLDIDGGTDIGEAIVDADLFIVDNGAGGTNRKVAASRLKTYAGGAGLVKIATGTFSGSETNVTLSGIDTTYDTYLCTVSDCRPGNDDVNLRMYLGTSGGFLTTDEYNSFMTNVYNGLTGTTYNTYSAYTGDSKQEFNLAGIGNDADYGIGGVMWLHFPGDPTVRNLYTWECSYMSFNNYFYGVRGQGGLDEDYDITQVKFQWSGGNGASGRCTLYGLSHA